MFIGESPYKVDDKGRVPLPPKFRRELKAGMVLAKGLEKCITVYPIAQWQKLSESLAAKAVGGASLRRATRAIFASASSASFDGQGRIVLPYALREHAGIADTAIVIGTNRTVELWSEEEWKVEKISADEQAAKIMEDLGA